MWHAIRNRKVERVLGLQHPDAPAAWRAIIDNSEDLLTSGVLERLGYLPSTLAIEIVLRASEVKELRWIPLPEPLDESIPWPRVEDDATWVEPDWVWLTASYVVVFEAKWGRGQIPLEAQLTGQRDRCKSRWPRKRLLHIAIVQSGNVTFPAGSSAATVLWSSLRATVDVELSRPLLAHERRLLTDVRDMLDARGVAVPFMDSLPAISVVDGLPPFMPTPPPDTLGALPSIVIDALPTFTW